MLTPHLGASTGEAQQAVSTILARQIIDFVATGAVAGCVNLPPLTPETAREVGPWMPLMTALGKLAGRLVPAPVKLQVTYAGRTEGLDTRPLTRLLVAALLGGVVRERVPYSAYLFYKYEGAGGERAFGTDPAATGWAACRTWTRWWRTCRPTSAQLKLHR